MSRLLLQKNLGSWAAGTDFQIAVPGNEIWVVKAISATLVCSSTVASRYPILNILVGGVTVSAIPTSQPLTASSTTQVGWSSAMRSTNSNIAMVGPLTPTTLGPGSVIGPLTVGLQAGDQWTNVVIWYMRYQGGTEVLVNNDFSNGFTGWTLNYPGVVVDTTQHIINAQSVKFPAYAGFGYILQTYNLFAGHTYTLTFWVMTDAAFTSSDGIAVALQGNPSFSGYHFSQTGAVPWTQYTHTWVQSVDRVAQNIFLTTNYGGAQSTGDMWIDGLTLVDGILPLVGNAPDWLGGALDPNLS